MSDLTFNCNAWVSGICGGKYSPEIPQNLGISGGIVGRFPCFAKNGGISGELIPHFKKLGRSLGKYFPVFKILWGFLGKMGNIFPGN